jgi:type I site-specific restriction-modification system R (restriction) subunit
MNEVHALVKALAKKGCKTAEDIGIDDYVKIIRAYLDNNPQSSLIRDDIYRIIEELKENPRLEKHLRKMTHDIGKIINSMLLELCKRVRA